MLNTFKMESLVAVYSHVRLAVYKPTKTAMKNNRNCRTKRSSVFTASLTTGVPLSKKNTSSFIFIVKEKYDWTAS